MRSVPLRTCVPARTARRRRDARRRRRWPAGHRISPRPPPPSRGWSYRGREGREELSRALHRRQTSVTVVTDCHDPNRDFRGAGVEEGAEPLLDARLAPRGEDVANLLRVPGVEQALVVGGYFGLGQDAVGPLDGNVDLV